MSSLPSEHLAATGFPLPDSSSAHVTTSQAATGARPLMRQPYYLGSEFCDWPRQAVASNLNYGTVIAQSQSGANTGYQNWTANTSRQQLIAPAGGSAIEADLLNASDLAREIKYSCGHCGRIKVTTSGCANGRTRIRCECGGHLQDGACRMHSR